MKLKHVKVYEDQDLLNDLRDLTLASKLHAYYIIVEGIEEKNKPKSYNKSPYSYAMVLIGEDLRELGLIMLGWLDMNEVTSLDKLKDGLDSNDIKTLMTEIKKVAANMFDEVFLYTVWELEPKNHNTVALKHTLTEVVNCYNMGNKYFSNFNNETSNNEYGNIN